MSSPAASKWGLVRFGFGGRRQALDFQAVIVLAPLALVQNRLGNLLDRQSGEVFDLAYSECRAVDDQRPIRPHIVGQGFDLLPAERLRRDVDEIRFGRVAVLPVDRITGGVGESLNLALMVREQNSDSAACDSPRSVDGAELGNEFFKSV